MVCGDGTVFKVQTVNHTLWPRTPLSLFLYPTPSLVSLSWKQPRIMPVHFTVAPHPAVPVAQPIMLQRPQDCLDLTWGRKSTIACAELLQSSLQLPTHRPLAQPLDSAILNSVLTSQDANLGPYMSPMFYNAQPAAMDLSQIRAQSNGFVDTVVEAYNRHHHLIIRCVHRFLVAMCSALKNGSFIRPDDVWLAMLSQFNL